MDLYLTLPCAIQSKILIYYLSYGTVASHALRDENGHGKCVDSELTIWQTRIEQKYGLKKKHVLRESIGFTQMDVLFDMRLAITAYDNHAARIYIKKILKEMTKNRLLKLIAEEPVLCKTQL
jgi:hypothetical protein